MQDRAIGKKRNNFINIFYAQDDDDDDNISNSEPNRLSRNSKKKGKSRKTQERGNPDTETQEMSTNRVQRVSLSETKGEKNKKSPFNAPSPRHATDPTPPVTLNACELLLACVLCPAHSSAAHGVQRLSWLGAAAAPAWN